MKKTRVGIHLDVGHDSIGWAVSRLTGDGPLLFSGAGSVLFAADDCLASTRRGFRRQRRHTRSTRQRIERLGTYLVKSGVLTTEETELNPTSSPWKLAAAVLKSGKRLTWPELWAVLRWYAHNRGYDGNELWSNRTRMTTDADEDDKKSFEAARELMSELGTGTMAETVCAVMGIDPDGSKSASTVYFKGKRISFDRNRIKQEVRQILASHLGVLPGLTELMIEVIMADPIRNPEFLRQVPGMEFPVHKRYLGGLLFGQLAPRFDNRIIGTCPISGGKVPSKTAEEFLAFRWAMVLANLKVGAEHRSLTLEEIAVLNKAADEQGGFTVAKFKELVAELTGTEKRFSNLEAMFLTPSAEEQLIRHPGLYALRKEFGDDLRLLDAKTLRWLCRKLVNGKTLARAEVLAAFPEDKRGLVAFVPKGKKKEHPEEVRISAKIAAGRAPYSRDVMEQATRAVLEGKDPRAAGGILYRDCTVEDVLPESKIDTATNNHLVRHRIRILLRLLKDIVAEYAENNLARISDITIEVARDIKDLSGKTNKQIEQDLGLRTAHHKKIAALLAAGLNIDPRRVSAGLIRKGRIADDLDYTCPYTGHKYDMLDVQSKTVDLDHILPRSQRQSDSLDSLVLTFKAVNQMKGNRTALEFIREFGGQPVPGRSNLMILTERNYANHINNLNIRGTHNDDVTRRKRRREKLLQFKASDSGMTPGLLTRTSHITSLAAQAVRGFFDSCSRTPRIAAIPGRVTAEVRMQWKIMNLLGAVDPRVLDENNELRLKQEIRRITHMHHAVDAVTLGLATMLLPQDGTLQALMLKRRLNEADKSALRTTGLFSFSEDRAVLNPLPEETIDSIHAVLAEQRVMIHQPARMDGLKTDQNLWGVVSVENGMATIRQRSRDEKTGAIAVKKETKPVGSYFGLQPKNGTGKLQALKGVLPFDTNFAVAVTEAGGTMLRHCHVYRHLTELREANGGRMPMLVKRGSLISVEKGKKGGIWRIQSIKDASRDGIMFDIIRPFATKVEHKVNWVGTNVTLVSLIRDGLRVLNPGLTGVSLCPITSSTSPAATAGSPAGTGS